MCACAPSPHLASPAQLEAVARAQRGAPGDTLVAVDLTGCLLVDDDALRNLTEACGATLRRLCVRDCRKLTDASFDAAAALPSLSVICPRFFSPEPAAPLRRRE